MVIALFAMNTVSITEARNTLPKLVKQVEEDLGQVAITVNGKAKAVIVSKQEWESHMSTLEILADNEALKALQQSEEEFQKGDYKTFEDVFGTPIHGA